MYNSISKPRFCISPMIGAALIGGGSSLLSGIGNLFGAQKQYENNSKLLQQQISGQQRLNDLAFQQNLTMWHAQNDYNSPTAQMSRLQEAGLNPNLVYGHLGNAAASSPPQLEPANVGRISAPNYGAIIGGAASDALDSIAKSAQVETISAQADYYKALARKTDSDARYRDEFNQLTNSFKRGQIDFLTNKIGMQPAQAELLSANIDKALKENNILQNNLSYQVDTYDARVYASVTSSAAEYWKLLNLKKDGKLKDKAFEKMAAEIRYRIAAAIQLENNPLGYTGEVGNAMRGANSVIDGVTAAYHGYKTGGFKGAIGNFIKGVRGK